MMEVRFEAFHRRLFVFLVTTTAVTVLSDLKWKSRKMAAVGRRLYGDAASGLRNDVLLPLMFLHAAAGAI